MQLNEQALLEAIGAITKKYELLNERTGGNFNIFSIAGISTKELVVCSVLCELLSPAGSHAQGSVYLALFAQRVLGVILSKDELANAQVYQEYVIDDSRRIDIVIQTAERFIPIEVKVYASDQPQQCYDYYQEAKRHMPNPTLYYLTRFGDPPSENSANGLTEGIRAISFSEDILDWLELCVKENGTLKIGPIREALLQFMSAIRQYTNQVEEDVEVEITELLMRSSENMKCAIAIQNSIDSARAALMERFFAAVEEKIAQQKLVNEYDYTFDEYKAVRTFYKRTRGNSACPGISYLYRKDIKPNVDVWVRLSLEWADGQAVLCAGYCCPIGQKSTEKQALSEEEIQALLGVNPEIDQWWVYWDYCPSNGSMESPDFASSEKSYLKLFDKEYFDQFVATCANQVLLLIEK